MSKIQREEYSLLKGPERRPNEEEDFHDGSCQIKAKGKWSRWSGAVLITTLACSALANLILVGVSLVLIHRLQGRDESANPPTASSPYAQLRDDPAVQFPYSTGYGPEITNHTLADIRWEAIDINAGIVALPADWAAEQNLPPSQSFPWDSSKSVYTLTAFHTLHCLKNIHRLLYDAHHGRPLSRDVGHAMHCVDHMRKDAMCNADDFLLPTPPERYGFDGPRGQARVCRDWTKLLDWAGQHHACYQHISDDEAAFAEDHKEIERYQNCPAGSPYESRMKTYFEEYPITRSPRL